LEDAGIFYGQFVNFAANWYILWKFGIFPPFGILYNEKFGKPAQKCHLHLQVNYMAHMYTKNWVALKVSCKLRTQK
jgi:hypothetical protein